MYDYKVEKPKDWPANSIEAHLENLMRQIEMFKKEPSYKNKEVFEIELYKENIWWEILYIGFSEKRNIAHPIPKETRYKDELFKLIINSKWKKS